MHWRTRLARKTGQTRPLRVLQTFYARENGRCRRELSYRLALPHENGCPQNRISLRISRMFSEILASEEHRPLTRWTSARNTIFLAVDHIVSFPWLLSFPI